MALALNPLHTPQIPCLYVTLQVNFHPGKERPPKKGANSNMNYRSFLKPISKQFGISKWLFNPK